jgi:predicted transcriptional regulator
MTSTVGIKLEEETKARLQELGARKDRSPHWMMKRAISEYLEREEVREDEKREDLARWNRFLETGEAIAQKDIGQFFDGLIAKADDASKK